MSCFDTAWPLYSEIHAICKDMGVHTSVASHLAGALMVLGCDHVSDVYGIPLERLSHHRGIGPTALMVARSFGAREVGD